RPSPAAKPPPRFAVSRQPKPDALSVRLAIRERRLDVELGSKLIETLTMRGCRNELLLSDNACVEHACNQSLSQFAGAQYSNPFVLKHAVPFPAKRNHSIVSRRMLIRFTGRNEAGT